MVLQKGFMEAFKVFNLLSYHKVVWKQQFKLFFFNQRSGWEKLTKIEWLAKWPYSSMSRNNSSNYLVTVKISSYKNTPEFKTVIFSLLCKSQGHGT